MHRIEFFFDCSSPGPISPSRASSRSRRAGRRDRLEADPGGRIFNSINPSVYESRQRPVPAKAKYAAKDLRDWARYVGIRIGTPPVFPVNSVKVMRGAFVAIEHVSSCPTRARVPALLGELADISQDAEVRLIAADSGLDPTNSCAGSPTRATRSCCASPRTNSSPWRVRLAHDVRGRQRHVLRQRPDAAGGRGAELIAIFSIVGFAICRSLPQEGSLLQRSRQRFQRAGGSARRAITCSAQARAVAWLVSTSRSYSPPCA